MRCRRRFTTRARRLAREGGGKTLGEQDEGSDGIQNFQQDMDVIGNNIANVNTTAFKSARVDFADAFSETLRGSAGANGTSSGVASVQIGSGVTTSAIRNIYTQGGLVGTGVVTDLGVSGDGFFIVRDPVNGAQFATRAGTFRLDANGYLTNDIGLHVQGFSDGASTTRGEIGRASCRERVYSSV